MFLVSKFDMSIVLVLRNAKALDISFIFLDVIQLKSSTSFPILAALNISAIDSNFGALRFFILIFSIRAYSNVLSIPSNFGAENPSNIRFSM